MDFEIGLIFIMGYLLSIAKSQTMMEVYYSAPGQEYRRIYTISGKITTNTNLNTNKVIFSTIF